jgi:hypothetical protein
MDRRRMEEGEVAMHAGRMGLVESRPTGVARRSLPICAWMSDSDLRGLRMANDEIVETLRMHLCAPIPVGHEVLVQFYELDEALFGTRFQIDVEQPSILDCTTGVTYGATWHPPNFFGLEKQLQEDYRKPRVSKRLIEGKVRACAVLLGNVPQERGDCVFTVLTIDKSATTYR